ncbi:urea carboxylase-associated family protein [Ruegeria profundi]|uniref:urea carboxylase-associated family protein n=1 Tax=Ruegeria profundi TaxID=1685378 RepID=UPI001F246B7C|nr:urea carboxylase-associated family protein [Ruegeria profundi]
MSATVQTTPSSNPRPRGTSKACDQAGNGWINRRRPILTLVEDTSPGVHDTFVASCDIYRYAQLGHQGYHDNCTDNLRMALAAIGLRPSPVLCPRNLWMNSPVVEGGAMEWRPAVSTMGARISIHAPRFYRFKRLFQAACAAAPASFAASSRVRVSADSTDAS